MDSVLEIREFLFILLGMLLVLHYKRKLTSIWGHVMLLYKLL